MPYSFCDLARQCFTSLEFRHIRFQPENDRNASDFLLAQSWLGDFQPLCRTREVQLIRQGKRSSLKTNVNGEWHAEIL
jgi:hypothetical protein